MRAAVLGLVALLAIAGCGDKIYPTGTTDYAYDPVCELQPVTVADVTYQVVGSKQVGTYTPAPEPTTGAYARGGTFERFDDGTATWTGNGYVVSFDAEADTGISQLC